MGLRSLLLLLHIAAAALRSDAAAFASPTTGVGPPCPPISRLSLLRRWLLLTRRLAPLPGGRGRWLVAGSIVKQLSSVVKWPRGAAAPHGGPKPPAHAPYAGELPAPGRGGFASLGIG